MTWTKGFDEPATLGEVGGKAVNLSRLTRAGFPVPPGFTVTTDAFRAVLDADDLRATVAAALAAVDPDDPTTADTAQDRIRAAFGTTRIPAPIAESVCDAYRRLGGGRVAVRSSATAEDLPELSFAGQQDTVLDVEGEDALLDAVRGCWASLWTARAISYRRQAGIPEEAAALAVAVQRMVPADVSGVLFTANPLTGHRGQLAVDATFGLGEALVSGQVEPDHVVADAATGRIVERTLGSKGGTRSADATLTDANVHHLVELGRRVQAEYGTPQDIEWAIHQGRLWLLQARAITSLFPVPDGAPEDSVWLSFGAFQGMLEPITPLGRDALLSVMAGVATLAGARVDPDTNPWVRPAGERLWVRIDGVLRTPIGRRVLPVFLSIGDPGARRIVLGLLDDGALLPSSASSLRSVAPRLARMVRALTRNVPMAMRDPNRLRARLDAVAEGCVQETAGELSAAATAPDPLRRAAARALATRRAMAGGLPALLPYAGGVIATPVLTLRAVSALTGAHGISPVALELTRALPHNVTTEMDLALWGVAAAADPAERDLLASLDAEELSARYARGRLPLRLADRVRDFLDAYGMRAVGEIDLGRPRWSDDPTDVFATLQRYLAIPADQTPPAQFARGEQAAQDALEQLVRRAGPVRGRAVRFLAGRVRTLAGGRELPKFTLVRMLGLARSALLASGQYLVQAGVLGAADDVFLLHAAELEDLASVTPELIRERRRTLDRESRRTQVPRVLLGDGRAFYEGLGDVAGDDGVLVGSPVSPGTVEGVVRVVRDPSRSGLQHGEILVCAGTDPAWTPLFLSAGGLVTEVGGMMTHGSVVAREYGLPAVVGVHEATTRLVTGQRVRLDGTAGTIVILDGATADPVAAGR